MLGVLNGDEKRMDEDPINQESGKVQFVIAVGAPRDFIEWGSAENSIAVRYKERAQPNTIENSFLMEAPSATHASPNDAPNSLVHGDADTDAPLSLSELFFKRRTDASVSSRFIRVPDGQHAFQFFDDWPKSLDDIDVKSFNQHLRGIASENLRTELNDKRFARTLGADLRSALPFQLLRPDFFTDGKRMLA